MTFKITYLDDTFTRKLRSLSVYNKIAYKEFIFDILPKLKEENKIDGKYEVELSSSKKFKQIYGRTILKFSVIKDAVLLEDIEPSDFLMAGYRLKLPNYHGIPYRNNKDLSKIKLLEKMEEIK